MNSQLSGHIQVHESFDIFSLVEVENILSNHLYVMNGRFGNKLIGKEPISVVRINSLSIALEAIDFDIQIGSLDMKDNTRIFIDAPDLKLKRGPDFISSADGLTYSANVSEVLPTSLLCLNAQGLTAGAAWRNLIATVVEGRIISWGPWLHHVEKITIEKNQMIVKYSMPLHGRHKGVFSSIWDRYNSAEPSDQE